MGVSAFRQAAVDAFLDTPPPIDWSTMTLERLAESRELCRLNISHAQRALCRVADGLEVSHLDPARLHFHLGIENARVYPAQDTLPRIVGVEAGVRSGKTVIAAFGGLLKSSMACTFRRAPDPDRPEEKPDEDGLIGVREGELVRSLIVSPRKGSSDAAFAFLIGAMKSSRALSRHLVKDGASEAVLIRPDGHHVQIKVVAAAPGGANLRSTWLAGVVFDEGAFFDEEDAAVSLGDNMRAAIPRLLPNAQAFVVSSPWEAEGEFHELIVSAFGKPGRTVSFHSDSLSMNPMVRPQDVADERARDPDNAAREWDAVPMDAGSLRFFPDAAIAATCTRDILWLDPNDQPHWAGSDLGLRKNSSAIALARHAAGKAELAYHEERIPAKGHPLKPSVVCKEFGELCIRFRATSLKGDIHYGDSASEELQKLVGPAGEVVYYDEWHTSEMVDVFTEFRRRMLEGLLVLPRCPRLMKQMKDVKIGKGKDGKTVIILPKHGAAHGDVLMAVVLAIVQVPLDIAPQEERRSYEDRMRFEGERGF